MSGYLRFPHTRGDGPVAPRVELVQCAFSPHPWGWTGVAGANHAALDVFPTPVGMDRLTRIRCNMHSVFPTPVGMDRHVGRCNWHVEGFPHTRGDGPTTLPRSCGQNWFSPHPWGWTALQYEVYDDEIVFPTPVGMDRLPRPRSRQKNRFPHTRGDGPAWWVIANWEPRFSPHPWGWTVLSAMTLNQIPRFPHTRGDGPFDLFLGVAGVAFSPHPWGWTGYVLVCEVMMNVFPTPVGMDRL